MVTPPYLTALFAGALLALPYALYAGRSRRPYLLFGVGLLVAALIYVAFAAVAADRQGVLGEAGGVLIFGLLVLLGVRSSPHWLAFGWLAHVVWDLVLHPVEYSGYSPWWYPVACIGFDLVVAGVILGIALRGRSAPGP